MQPLPLFAEVRWTVTDLTRHVRQVIESDESLQDVWVTGELSNLSRPASGHIYFTLKDAGASLRCVVWRSEAGRVKAPLQDGMAVEAHGRIGVYEAGGQYQLYADRVRPAGEGALYAEFVRLKAKLEAEGLFASERKRPIPDWPKRIGVVTSATGAALRDVLNTLARRLPLAEVVLSPAPVQGADAPPKLVAALEALRAHAPDVVLLARGGGSLEDLWAFNDERVVRAVAACPFPVITGVGHETDFTLVDFAADLRAPTPTAAAELATPNTRADLLALLEGYAERIWDASLQRVAFAYRALEARELRLRSVSPVTRLRSDRQRLDEYARRAGAAQSHRLRLSGERLGGARSRLKALDPLAILQRGFALITRRADGALVRAVGQARAGESLGVRVSDGEFDVTVSKK